jgi:hypothetical protein
MKSIALLTATETLLVVPAVASASRHSMSYTGRTSSGSAVTFQVARGRMYNLRAGVRVSCVPIQGGTTPTGGIDAFSFNGSIPLATHVRFKFLAKTALWFNPVTKAHDIWLKRHGDTITGQLRLEFSFWSRSSPPAPSPSTAASEARPSKRIHSDNDQDAAAAIGYAAASDVPDRAHAWLNRAILVSRWWWVDRRARVICERPTGELDPYGAGPRWGTFGAARIAGKRPTSAPIPIAAAIPPPQASGGITVAQPSV